LLETLPPESLHHCLQVLLTIQRTIIRMRKNDGEEDNEEDYGSVRLVNEDEEKEANTWIVNGQDEMKLIITLRRRTRLKMTKMIVR
jgi:hypothetical protein